MYVPNHFAVTDSGIADVLGAGGLAHLVTPTSSGLVSTPLPLLHDAAAGPRGSLVGHVARNNPHWQVKPTGDSLAIIAGPHAYISPSWYPSKHEHGRAVPTWNYAVVHVHGQLLVRDDVAWLRAHVTALTDTHEAGRDPAWRVTDAPADFVEGQLRAIVGIELQITHIEGKAKLSQNRPDADRRGVVDGLSVSRSPSDLALCAAMSARLGAAREGPSAIAPRASTPGEGDARR